jgi:chromate reductase
MASRREIAVLVGSLRKESFSRKAANALISLAPESLNPAIFEIGQLPLYNQDLERASPPAEWVAFRDRVRPVQGVLFVTPEYNRSVPGLLKNALMSARALPAKACGTENPSG